MPCPGWPSGSGSGPGTTTTLTLDASGQLAEQIKAGAPFDVFLAANAKFVERPGRGRSRSFPNRSGLTPAGRSCSASTGPSAIQVRRPRPT